MATKIAIAPSLALCWGREHRPDLERLWDENRVHGVVYPLYLRRWDARNWWPCQLGMAEPARFDPVTTEPIPDLNIFRTDTEEPDVICNRTGHESEECRGSSRWITSPRETVPGNRPRRRG